MKKYIQNLTDHLIRKNRYDLVRERFLSRARDSFLRFVMLELAAGDVRDMSPETLGKIMCSFESEDIMATANELYSKLHFAGCCEDLLRDLTSLCLAYVIRERVFPTADTKIAPYLHIPKIPARQQ